MRFELAGWLFDFRRYSSPQRSEPISRPRRYVYGHDSKTWKDVLAFLAEHGPVTKAAIAAALDVTTVPQVLVAMRADGLISMQRITVGSSKGSYSLTADGHARYLALNGDKTNTDTTP